MTMEAHDMPRPIHHRSDHSRYCLQPEQLAAIEDVAIGLPEKLRHYFNLHVGSALDLSRDPHGNVSNQKVAAAINQSLREIGIVR